MRIGTWNMQGKSQTSHLEFLARGACDVWLLTEVSDKFAAAMAPGSTTLSDDMGPRKAYAAVWAKDGLVELPSIHQAAAFATVGDLRVCSCVLPWRAARLSWPDEGANLAGITRAALGRLEEGLTQRPGDVVWGGDWNHALEGPDHVGTRVGRSTLKALIATLGLQAPTAELGHRDRGMCSIDHIAVPERWKVGSAEQLTAEADGRRLSDHDAYVVELETS
jgi:hypothetical protein